MVKFNATKTDYMIVSKKRNRPNHPDIILNSEIISESENHTQFEVTINNKLSWSVHINMAIAEVVDVAIKSQERVGKPCTKQLFDLFLITGI